MRLLENLSRFDEDVAEFQVIDQRVHCSFKRRLKNQICFGQRRLRARQQSWPVLEGPVKAKGNAAEYKTQQQKSQKVVTQERYIRRFYLKKKEPKHQLIHHWAKRREDERGGKTDQLFILSGQEPVLSLQLAQVDVETISSLQQASFTLRYCRFSLQSRMEQNKTHKKHNC